MSLREEIAKFVENVAKNIPEKTRAVMEEETLRLAESGIAARSLKEGDRAPAFALSNGKGTLVSSADLLARGPLVVSFYRGGW